MTDTYELLNRRQKIICDYHDELLEWQLEYVAGPIAERIEATFLFSWMPLQWEGRYESQ